MKDRDSEDRSNRDRPHRGGSGDRNRRPRRDGERGYGSRQRSDGERQGRDGGPQRRDGAQQRRDGERRYRDGERRYDERPRRDGDRRYGDRPRRDDGREYGERGHRGRPQGQRRDTRRGDRDERGGDQRYGRGGTRGGGRSDRGGAGREFTAAERLQHELRPVRAEHTDPELPDEVQAKDLPAAARNELKTLQTETQEWVARHLAMVAALIDDDPELAHQHAISASRRAGRIPVARETLAATAYRIGDYALALRELRTHRRLSGSQGNIALMVEAERALGRPQKAIETGLEADTKSLNAAQRAQLAIAMSGARLDLGQTQQALFELEIPQLDPERAFSYSSELFAAYAAVLEDLGREAEAAPWRARAERADAMLNAEAAAADEVVVFEVHEQVSESEHESEVGAEADNEVANEAENANKAEREPAPSPVEDEDAPAPAPASDPSTGPVEGTEGPQEGAR